MTLASIAWQYISEFQVFKLFHRQVNSAGIQRVVRRYTGGWKMQTSDLFPGECWTFANEQHWCTKISEMRGAQELQILTQ